MHLYVHWRVLKIPSSNPVLSPLNLFHVYTTKLSETHVYIFSLDLHCQSGLTSLFEHKFCTYVFSFPHMPLIPFIWFFLYWSYIIIWRVQALNLACPWLDGEVFTAAPTRLLVTTFYGQWIICCSTLLLCQLVCASLCTIHLYDEKF